MCLSYVVESRSIIILVKKGQFSSIKLFENCEIIFHVMLSAYFFIARKYS